MGATREGGQEWSVLTLVQVTTVLKDGAMVTVVRGDTITVQGDKMLDVTQ